MCDASASHDPDELFRAVVALTAVKGKEVAPNVEVQRCLEGTDEVYWRLHEQLVRKHCDPDRAPHWREQCLDAI